MKKKLALILAGTAMAAMVLAGCGEKNNASGEDVKTAESVEDKKTSRSQESNHCNSKNASNSIIQYAEK